MGYSTSFRGKVRVEPPLDEREVEYLRGFSQSRRVHRAKGPYFVGRDDEADVVDVNAPPRGQPGLYCDLEPSPDGTSIGWNGNEKSYRVDMWMKYLVEHFLAPGARAKGELPFMRANHVLNGVIEAQGEDPDDRWDLAVEDNRVYVRRHTSSWTLGDRQEVR